MKSRLALQLTLALCLSLGTTLDTRAQDVDNRGSPVFLEKQYIFGRLPTNQLLFEALLTPHLYLHEGRYQDRGEVYVGPVWTWRYAFTPMVRLRMMSTNSRPVRTPSYMPRPFTLQFLRANLIEPARDDSSAIRVWGLTLIPWAHHSNGQDGCLFMDQVKVGDDCQNGLLAPGARRVTNKTDGSFSTNYVRATLGYRKLVMDIVPDGSPGEGLLESVRTCEVTLGAEYHPKGYGPGSLGHAQSQLYPTFRLQGSATLAGLTFGGRSSLSSSVEWLNRPAYDVSHWIFSAEASHAFGRSGWGLFARYYRGMDYYNLGFLNSLSTWNLGIAIDAWRPEQFGVPMSPVAKGSTTYPRNFWLDRVLAWPADRLCSITGG